MIRIGKVLILDTTDYIVSSEKKTALELTIDDLRKKSHDAALTSDLVIATTHQKETVVLKNRSGCEGIVVPLHTYQEFLNWLDENNKSSSPSPKEHHVGRVRKFNFWPFNRS